MNLMLTNLYNVADLDLLDFFPPPFAFPDTRTCALALAVVEFLG